MTTLENDDNGHQQQIQVVLGNRPVDKDWRNDGYLPENWNLTNTDVGWKTPDNPPTGWRSTCDNGDYLPSGWKTRNNNITIHRDNRKILASMLPTIFVTNHRSFFPKFYNFLEVIKTLGLTLGLHSEIWEDQENKQHQNKIEEALELEGIQYI